MSAIERLTDPHVSTYLTVLPGGRGVCDVCHGAPGPGFAQCESCYQVMRQVSAPCRLVVPISLAEPDGQLYTVLRGYKNESHPRQHDFELQVAALVGRFLRDHGLCIEAAAGGGWTTIAVVPSTTGRSGVHPLERAVRRVNFISDVHRSPLKRGGGALGHRQASDEGFEVVESVEGERVLLVDNTFTSGARSQSAASALAIAGAEVVGIVVVGRFVRPHQDHPQNEQLIKRSRSIPFDFGSCCLEET